MASLSSLTHIEEAILRTVIYADIFNFPLTRTELHHYLIAETPISQAQVEQALASSKFLKQELDIHPPYIVCAGHQALIPLRIERDSASLKLWSLALNYGHALGRLPFVRMVALTGALAMRNAAANDDDLDYVLVTAPGRVWLARAFAIVLVRLAKRRGIVVCPNYLLAESALAQDRHDLFVAHEVTQMVPMYGRELYETMRAQNRWVDDYLPNAVAPFYVEAEPSGQASWLKQIAEFLLGGRIGDALEQWEYRRKLRRFAGEMLTPHSAAQLDDQHVKGHFKDHGHPVMQQYHERLRAYDLDVLPLAGD
ncbi:MAG: hypothetical protein GC204_12795 [Chloroflexi bacterium]|nr:hypothetical protein [Chloroflexota bacterium]